ncbi:riboflavin synthase-like protein [Xylaria arbuscula]|nr:riboflavin synthase-like protein [Xylaria arbuscula]
MFTGLVEEIGTVVELDSHDETGGTSLTIGLPASSKLLDGAALGDSIAINGVCLTATWLSSSSSSGEVKEQQQPSFKVGIAPETLRLTNLGQLVKGSGVNLERAVRADTRMGGHFVQGHVDTTAEIIRVAADGNAVTFRFQPREAEQREAVMRYVVHKGFIALDGTSLTITRVNDEEGWWEVMLIAYTQEKVVLAKKKVGESVNVEVDVLAKYAEKSMKGYLGAEGGRALLQPFLEKMVQDLVAQALGSNAGK